MEEIPFGGVNQITRRGFYGVLLSVLLFCQMAAAANTPPGHIMVREPVYAYEGQVFTIEGSFQDADVEDAHTVSIFWEVGVITTTRLAPGVLRFTASYTYYYDSFLPIYPLVQVEDEHGAADISSFAVTVLNVAPTINAVRMNTNIFDEGDQLQVEVDFSDPGLYDHHRVEIDWGDLVDPFDVPGRFFARNHAFFDDTIFGSGVPIAEVTITVWDESDYHRWRTNIVVRNVPPVITQPALSSRMIAENGSITLSGHFEDRGWYDRHVVTVDWGDGSPVEEMSPAGVRDFTLAHPYRDDPPAGRADLYAITLSVTDDDGATSVTNLSVGVTNVAPRLSNVLFAARVPAHSMGLLKGTIEEQSPLDSLALDIDWGDGTGTQRVAIVPGSSSFAVPHTFRTGGPRNVRVALSDDDGGRATANVAVNLADSRGRPRGPPGLRMVRRGKETCVEWGMPGAVLQSAPTASGPWTDVTSAARSPFPLVTTEGARFFRLRPHGGQSRDN
jgi:hypothetical protein